jgi:hypothetical protein
MKIITVYCVADKEIIPLTYSGDTFTVESAEESVRNHGFTILYSTIK